MAQIHKNVTFKINGNTTEVEASKFRADYALVDFLRKNVSLTGTKATCREGGCGACVVAVQKTDGTTKAINSCLVPVLGCDGWIVSTVEELGNQRTGYHRIQQQLVAKGGTQCGFCSPGMVMSMYSTLETGQNLTPEKIIQNLDGNICRCTGYRSILDAFKTFTICSSKCVSPCPKIEIEECVGSPCPLKSVKSRNLNGILGNGLAEEETQTTYFITSSGQKWIVPKTLKALLQVVHESRERYSFVAGSTSVGLFKNMSSKTVKKFIDLNHVEELGKHTLSENTVILGARISITESILLLKRGSLFNGYEYLAQVAEHWEGIANTPVRNMGTLGGNLMLRHTHGTAFQSDVFLSLAAIGARVLVRSPTTTQEVGMEDFLQQDMLGKLIVSIQFPFLSIQDGYVYQSFKVMKRKQNSRPYLTAAFLFQLEASPTFEFKSRPTILYNAPNFLHAGETETFLEGKSLADRSILRRALDILVQESKSLFVCATTYQQTLTATLFYKATLKIIGQITDPRLTSGGTKLTREVSRGQQTFETDPKVWPINQPILKIESTVQCAGEAQYVDDISAQPGELFAAFLLSERGPGTLKSIDPSFALKLEGVVDFISARDIPGTNNYMIPLPLYMATNETEEILVTRHVRCEGQALGILVGINRDVVVSALPLIRVEYEEQEFEKPKLNIGKVIEEAEVNGTYSSLLLPDFNAKLERDALTDNDNSSEICRIQGSITMGSQYYFHMETQSALAVPTANGFDIYSSTQAMDAVQEIISCTLGITSNRVRVKVGRLGGGFGAKLLRSVPVAVGAGLASHRLHKPVRLVLDLETNMRMIGKRLPYVSKYEVEFNRTGKIIALKNDLICDAGFASNEITSEYAILFLQNAYSALGWNVRAGKVNTNTVSNTFCRAPGVSQAIAATEYIMEHIAAYLGKDPWEVRSVNFLKRGDLMLGLPGRVQEFENPIHAIMEEMRVSAELDRRKAGILEFNEENRWKKRGLGIVPMRHMQLYNDFGFPVFVAICHIDGGVTICAGGVEMGQGLNTKAVQAVALALGIPIDLITVEPANTIVSVNAGMTGSGSSSEFTVYAATKACEILNERISMIRATMETGYTWKLLIQRCYEEEVDLKATYMPSKRDHLRNYDVWGLNVTEVEVDLLTGEYKLVRVDMTQDAGKSLNPGLDIGQIEGSLIMGYGWWMMEQLEHHPDTGALLTKNSFTYAVPLALDIPEDLRVTLLPNASHPYGIMGSKYIMIRVYKSKMGVKQRKKYSDKLLTLVVNAVKTGGMTIKRLSLPAGEPAVCLTVAVVFAVRNALNSARKENGYQNYFEMDGPVTPDVVLKLALTSKENLCF